MTSEHDPTWQYQIGPGPDLTREIGQVIINYSECERSIFRIFSAIMDLSDQDAYLLVRHANVNAEKMLSVIKAEIDRVKPKILVDPIKEALDIFKSTIEHRNIVAHWQWAVTEGEVGLAFNDLKAKPGEDNLGRSFSLNDLKATAWKLAKASTLLSAASTMMFSSPPKSLSDPDWTTRSYSNRGALDEWMIAAALHQLRDHLQKGEDHFRRGGPKAS